MRESHETLWAAVVFAVLLFTIDSVFDLGIIPDPLHPSPRVETEDVYFENVQPIFHNRCVSCHSSDRWNWTIYEVAFKKRAEIRKRVWVTRSMPFGQSMLEGERRMIRDWVDGGAKK